MWPCGMKGNGTRMGGSLWISHGNRDCHFTFCNTLKFSQTNRWQSLQAYPHYIGTEYMLVTHKTMYQNNVNEPPMRVGKPHGYH